MAAVAGHCCQILAEKEKKGKKNPFNNLGSLNLDFAKKKIAKKGKKKEKNELRQSPSTQADFFSFCHKTVLEYYYCSRHKIVPQNSTQMIL